jgi:hypothetical protein
MIWIRYWIEARKKAQKAGKESAFVPAYERLGDLIWDEKNLSTEPAGHVQLTGLLQPYELNTESGVQGFDPEASPLVWLQNLYRCYQSATLRVYRAKEVRPLKKSFPLDTRERWSLGRESK